MSKFFESLLLVLAVSFIAFALALWVLDMTFEQYFDAVIKFYF